MDSGIALYSELQEKIDEMLLKLDECFESINSISIWKSLNGLGDDPYREEFEQTLRAMVCAEFGDEVGEKLMEILFG